MSTQPLISRPLSPGRAVRVEYLDRRDVHEHREYRFRIYGLDGSSEVRMRIANAAFDARRIRMQDGPDVCYQKVLRAIAAGAPPGPEVITIEDVDLFSYRDEHVHVAKRRMRTPPPADAAPFAAAPSPEPRRQAQYRPRTPRPAAPRLPAPALVAVAPEPVLDEGQRVRHAVFGIGVTISASRARTVVRFDEEGPRTFVTSMVELEVLTAPHTWETSPRGVNRPCRAPAVE
jgi:hypothetical protein